MDVREAGMWVAWKAALKAAPAGERRVGLKAGWKAGWKAEWKVATTAGQWVSRMVATFEGPVMAVAMVFQIVGLWAFQRVVSMAEMMVVTMDWGWAVS